MAKQRKWRDPMESMAKDKIIAAYHAIKTELDAHNRLEHLRARNIAPFALETVSLAEFHQEYPGEYLTAEVYTPASPSGGVLRLVWRCYDAKEDRVVESSVRVCYWEQFKSENGAQITGYKILRERLEQAIDRRMHPAPRRSSSDQAPAEQAAA
jgi:hypothetical protein